MGHLGRFFDLFLKTVRNIFLPSIAVNHIKVRSDLGLRTTLTGQDICVGCKLCVKTCPAKALSVETLKEQDIGRVISFTADMNKCVYCGLCVDACPMHALTFLQRQSQPSSDKADFILNKVALEQKALGQKGERV